MADPYPFLISIPHGGLEIPPLIRDRVILDRADLSYYCDPETRFLYGFQPRVKALLDTSISRMAVDLNRPPYALPFRRTDGVVKFRTPDGKPVYRSGENPDIHLIHRLLMDHYFPYHAELDRLLDDGIAIAFDCHSMLPVGPPGQKDAGMRRPLVCLGNNGDSAGEARKRSLSTCPPEWVRSLAGSLEDALALDEKVAINRPFTGGFISNAHYWRKGIPWIQIEVNRCLYEGEGGSSRREALKSALWEALTEFWERKVPQAGKRR